MDAQQCLELRNELQTIHRQLQHHAELWARQEVKRDTWAKQDKETAERCTNNMVMALDRIARALEGV